MRSGRGWKVRQSAPLISLTERLGKWWLLKFMIRQP
jgi:hypothetical protein